MPTPNDPVGTKQVYRIINRTGMRIGTAKFKKDVFIGTDGFCPQLPIASCMSTDHGDIRKAFGKCGNVPRRRLSREVGAARPSGVSSHLDPGMDIDRGIQRGGIPDNLVIVGMVTSDAQFITTYILDPDARAIFYPFFHFGTTFFG